MSYFYLISWIFILIPSIRLLICCKCCLLFLYCYFCGGQGIIHDVVGPDVYICVNLLLLMFTIPNVPNSMNYTVAYFLSISSTNLRTRVRSELLNISLVSSHVKVYTVLLVLIVGSRFAQGVLPYADLSADLLSQTKPIGWDPCWLSLCQFACCISSFRSWACCGPMAMGIFR